MLSYNVLSFQMNETIKEEVMSNLRLVGASGEESDSLAPSVSLSLSDSLVSLCPWPLVLFTIPRPHSLGNLVSVALDFNFFLFCWS